MGSKHSFIVFTGVIACFIACVGDFLVTIILGSHYPGYSQLFNTMSSLGASTSPVSYLTNLWWLILGLLMITFAIGFWQAFPKGTKYVSLVTWLIILYGLGEGFGSGLFKSDQTGVFINPSFIHDFLGGVGILAIIILPMIVPKIIPCFSGLDFKRFSLFVLLSGIMMWTLFFFRYVNHGDNFIAVYKGLWQRLFVLDYYLYLSVIAIMILNKRTHTD